jgi:excisionase family DNA binding protein
LDKREKAQRGETMSEMTTAIAIERPYLSWDEAAAYSGLSVNTLRRVVRAGKLRPYRPVQRRALLSSDELRGFIEASVLPVEERV